MVAEHEIREADLSPMDHHKSHLPTRVGGFYILYISGIRTLRGRGALRKQSCGLFLVTKCEAGIVCVANGAEHERREAALSPMDHHKSHLPKG